MPDYDFSGLNPRAFEHMIQALAAKILGHGVVVFGDGPDGGREATFEGKTSGYPSKEECWDGYIVVQAKFRQRPKPKEETDQQWALTELQKELQTFATKKRGRKKPQYYIFVTNAVLTAVQKKGGKDKADAVFQKNNKQIGIQDYRIWDHDQLSRFLDG